ncbi:uncharacterized protein LOC128218693 [Mya arenaria]|uniref:uncharacterized protein LOC128218693 n=1 Tax=Mya arenaria TaxID=6604 RepID=UPI0022DEBD5C|nr:uncharacterized protein LOC128218693 [Mya arenaria]
MKTCLWTVLSLLVLPCSCEICRFNSLEVDCRYKIDGVTVSHITGRIEPCDDPVSVTFEITSDQYPVDFTYTFESSSRVMVPRFPLEVFLEVNLDVLGDKKLHVEADFQVFGLPDADFINEEVDLSVVLERCLNAAARIAIGFMCGLLAIVVAMLIILLVIRHKKNKAVRLRLSYLTQNVDAPEYQYRESDHGTAYENTVTNEVIPSNVNEAEEENRSRTRIVGGTESRRTATQNNLVERNLSLPDYATCMESEQNHGQSDQRTYLEIQPERSPNQARTENRNIVPSVQHYTQDTPDGVHVSCASTNECNDANSFERNGQHTNSQVADMENPVERYILRNQNTPMFHIRRPSKTYPSDRMNGQRSGRDNERSRERMNRQERGNHDVRSRDNNNRGVRNGNIQSMVRDDENERKRDSYYEAITGRNGRENVTSARIKNNDAGDMDRGRNSGDIARVNGNMREHESYNDRSRSDIVESDKIRKAEGIDRNTRDADSNGRYIGANGRDMHGNRRDITRDIRGHERNRHVAENGRIFENNVSGNIREKRNTDERARASEISSEKLGPRNKDDRTRTSEKCPDKLGHKKTHHCHNSLEIVGKNTGKVNNHEMGRNIDRESGFIHNPNGTEQHDERGGVSFSRVRGNRLVLDESTREKPRTSDDQLSSSGPNSLPSSPDRMQFLHEQKNELEEDSKHKSSYV